LAVCFRNTTISPTLRTPTVVLRMAAAAPATVPAKDGAKIRRVLVRRLRQSGRFLPERGRQAARCQSHTSLARPRTSLRALGPQLFDVDGTLVKSDPASNRVHKDAFTHGMAAVMGPGFEGISIEEASRCASGQLAGSVCCDGGAWRRQVAGWMAHTRGRPSTVARVLPHLAPASADRAPGHDGPVDRGRAAGKAGRARGHHQGAPARHPRRDGGVLRGAEGPDRRVAAAGRARAAGGAGGAGGHAAGPGYRQPGAHRAPQAGGVGAGRCVPCAQGRGHSFQAGHLAWSVLTPDPQLSVHRCHPVLQATLRSAASAATTTTGASWSSWPWRGRRDCTQAWTRRRALSTTRATRCTTCPRRCTRARGAWASRRATSHARFWRR
jgi:hypothetical protein